jgi:hypothetical protein
LVGGCKIFGILLLNLQFLYVGFFSVCRHLTTWQKKIDRKRVNSFDTAMMTRHSPPFYFSSVLLGSLLLAAALIAPSSLHAGASNKNGNPYGNSTFFPDSGTFSAIVRSSNGFLGVLEFTTSGATITNSANSTNTGIATVYASGFQFVGTAFGATESSSSAIAVTYQGDYIQNISSANVSNVITAETNGYTNIQQIVTTNYLVTNYSYSTNYSTNITSVNNGGVVTTSTNISVVITTNQLSVSNTVFTVTNYVTTNNIVNVTNAVYTSTPTVMSNTVSGQFIASLQNAYPTQVFNNGSGQATVSLMAPSTNNNGTVNLIYVPFDTTATGERLTQ